jgi:hypothetical protein
MDKKVIYYFLKITLLTFAFVVVINLAIGFFNNFTLNTSKIETNSTIISKTEADKNSDNFVAA